MREILKALGPPGSIRFLLIGFAIGAAIVWRLTTRRRTFAAIWFALLGGGYAAMSLPIVAAALTASLPPVAVASPAQIRSVRTLFLLDGDNRVGRLATARDLVVQNKPDLVFLVGRQSTAAHLIFTGEPRERIVTDVESGNTQAQLKYVERQLQKPVPGPSGLIASALQMPRISGLLARDGVQILLIPSPVDAPVHADGLRRFLPSLDALAISREAIYEHAALIYFSFRGWT